MSGLSLEVLEKHGVALVVVEVLHVGTWALSVHVLEIFWVAGVRADSILAVFCVHVDERHLGWVFNYNLKLIINIQLNRSLKMTIFLI